MKKELPKAYEPANYEDDIYKKWEESGFFNPDVCVEKGICDKDADTYTIVLPPPNITDKLHLGHVVMVAVSDILIRYNRMNGKKALWVPGTDHAAIATQNVVEKKLWNEEKITRHDLGREKFLERVWEFVNKTQATIIHQLKKTGASLDWTREAFTLDEKRQKAVKQMFVDMYKEGVIYRGYRIVNWCPRCHSTLADDEIEYREQDAKFYTFKYSKNFPFSISTTRPETKLGDTAVAVNPNDTRYQNYIGKEYEVDFCGVSLKLKIIGDENVDPKFGTGALGVTPAHSLVDYEMAQKNNLEIKKIINEEGKIASGLGEASGLPVEKARELIVEKLRSEGLLEKEEEIKNNLSICYRCGAAIEPLTSRQWFVKVDKKLERLGGKSLKEKAIEAAKKNEIKFVPERFTKRYLNWMENLHDWCISRQIWFGHQIPAWYRKENKSRSVKICFMRHGQTDWNVKSIMQGQTETELNETGKKQAKEKAKAIEDFNPDIIISSPQKRCIDTVKIAIGEKYQTITDDRLKERYYGKIEGMQINEIKEKYPDLESFTKNNLPYLIECPGGESYEQVYERAKNLLIDVVKKYSGKKVLIMSHGDPLDMIEAIIMKKTWKEGVGSWHDNTRCVEINFSYDDDAGLNTSSGSSDGEEVYVGMEAPAGEWTQEEDVLDTWFSSGMWTFSTLGWPDQTKDLKTYHPTQVLETGYEIITLWVSRMIMMSYFAMNEIPFNTVYLHGMVLDKNGKKMSKSKGNGIDPLEMISKYGTDATRLSLIVGNTPGNDTRISEEKIASYRNFANKLWNISRFVLGYYEIKTDYKVDVKNLTEADNWILIKFQVLVKQVTEDLEAYNFSQAGERLREFTWNNLADWYLEVAKFEKTENKNEILSYILINLLKLWHPFIPFVTEAIWAEMEIKQMIIVESWPQHSILQELEKKLYLTPKDLFSWVPFNSLSSIDSSKFNVIKNIIIAIRYARAENKVESIKKIKAVIYAGKNKNLIESQKHLIKNLKTGISELEILSKGPKLEKAVYAAVGDIEIYLIGAIDEEKEKERIKKEIESLEKIIKSTEIKLSNKEFVERAPEKVVDAEKERLASAQSELKKLKEQVKS